MAKSILEIEEARSRLQRMTDDHQTLVELIKRLKHIRGEMESQLGRTDTILAKSEKATEEFQATQRRGLSLLDDVKLKSKSAFKDLEDYFAQNRDKVEKFCKIKNDELQETYRRRETTLQEIHRENLHWRKGIEAQHSSFEKKHFLVLDQVNHAYEKARIVLESQAPLVHGLDLEVKELKELQEELVRQVQEKFKGFGEELIRMEQRIQSSAQSSLSLLQEQQAEMKKETLEWKTKLDHQQHVVRKRIGRHTAYIFLLLLLMFGSATAIALKWGHLSNAQ